MPVRTALDVVEGRTLFGPRAVANLPKRWRKRAMAGVKGGLEFLIKDQALPVLGLVYDLAAACRKAGDVKGYDH